MINTLILDRGHATLDAKGKYITPGKQAKLPDGRLVYEGKENQRYTEAIAKYAFAKGFKVEYTVLPTDPTDPSLHYRVLKANNSNNRRNSLYLSLHNNAANGKASGTEVFTNVGQSLSDGFAEAIINEYLSELPERKMRIETVDGDKDKEALFYVLKNTTMPAVLIEFGFFDNPVDYDYLSNQVIIDKFAKATVEGIYKQVVKLYGLTAWENRNI